MSFNVSPNFLWIKILFDAIFYQLFFYNCDTVKQILVVLSVAILLTV